MRTSWKPRRYHTWMLSLKRDELIARPHFASVLDHVHESLRLYPAMANDGRAAVHADVIPLNEPITTPSGQVLRGIRVDAGHVWVSVLFLRKRNSLCL
ncbi:hypothetical protein NEOLEDRAFT_273142 [Neolentinus lepideus HHB14362 ss-1]|uniref:Uncharacterized protein n=1 Tax=Neolentinus lepideus HHB14362 ss-1 TaxID=1314782 RepID=A0A165T4V2_9AGAM|nr:hypothetical protein NEOLEDRAFT_273142 [Neolentinus lepideus HHB14362 ss-1]